MGLFMCVFVVILNCVVACVFVVFECLLYLMSFVFVCVLSSVV